MTSLSTVREILESLTGGSLSLEQAQEEIEKAAFDRMRLQYVDKLARLDLNRAQRTGIPEVILAQGKKDEWVERLVFEMAREKGRGIASRVTPELAIRIAGTAPEGFKADVHLDARIVVVKDVHFVSPRTGGRIGLLTAGTADIAVAEEARVFATEMGCDVFWVYDVGIAGIHRTLDALHTLMKEDVDVIIVVAGMDAVLPITVRGLVNLPVIGVPSSVGYGIGDKGMAPLMTMLQSCSPGLTVVNIDNGFGAASFAALTASRVAKYRNQVAGKEA
jgi:NCAIR mutase (PurE)-related protein